MQKEIIIDGIDISECEFANACDKKMKCTILQDDVCETNPYCERYDCYYKQLQRLKQKNESINKDLLTERQENATLAYNLHLKEQENAELKIVKEQLKKWNDENLKRQDNMQLWIDLAEEQRKNYRSALEEIKEIATNYFEECGIPENYFKRNNVSWKQHQIKALTCKLQQILDKINEVLGNEKM